MEIEFLILSDAAEVSAGKLYLMGGGWNQWRAAAYPAQLRCGIAVGLLVPWDQTNERHAVRISLLDSDGRLVVPEMGAELEAGRPPGITPGEKQRAMIAVNGVFPIERPGRYEIRATTNPTEPHRTVTFEALLSGGQSYQVQ